MGPYNLRLLKTLPHACGYFDDRQATHVVLDPTSATIERDYDMALTLGFRRAGGHVYTPHCRDCQACTPCRIRLDDFQPNRNQRRCIRRNADLEVRITDPGCSDERLELYQRYMRARHPGGGMDPARGEDFDNFLTAPWSHTEFVEARLHGKLLAVAVTDVCRSGLSAVYTFFEPEEHARSLGTWAILQQIKMGRQRGLPHLYLGFWIAGHPKMDYKRRFNALELFRGGRWQGAWAAETQAAAAAPFWPDFPPIFVE